MATIIFDFDGTIADSFDYVADFLAREAGRYPLNEEEKDGLRGLSMFAMARKLNFQWWELPGLFIRGRSRMHHTIKKLDPFAGMPELIRKLHAEGHELFIVSSNSLRNVRSFMRRHELQQYFIDMYGGIGLFGKAPALRRLLRRQQLEKASAVYIGDELRDVESAQLIDMRVIAVTWGFAHPADLKALKPTALVRTPDELFKKLETI